MCANCKSERKVLSEQYGLYKCIIHSSEFLFSFTEKSFFQLFINVCISGTGKHDIVLLLKLRISASDVVTFLHNNHSQYVKITFSDNYILHRA